MNLNRDDVLAWLVAQTPETIDEVISGVCVKWNIKNFRPITVQDFSNIVFLQSYDKITAIKAVRSVFNIGLKEAKDLVEYSATAKHNIMLTYNQLVTLVGVTEPIDLEFYVRKLNQTTRLPCFISFSTYQL